MMMSSNNVWLCKFVWFSWPKVTRKTIKFCSRVEKSFVATSAEFNWLPSAYTCANNMYWYKKPKMEKTTWKIELENVSNFLTSVKKWQTANAFLVSCYWNNGVQNHAKVSEVSPYFEKLVNARSWFCHLSTLITNSKLIRVFIKQFRLSMKLDSFGKCNKFSGFVLRALCERIGGNKFRNKSRSQ